MSITKIALRSLLGISLGLASLQAQEQDGFFAGFGLGFGGGGAIISAKLPSSPTRETQTAQNFTNYDLKVGYKSFINEWLGLRGYFSLGYSSAKNRVRGSELGLGSQISDQDFSVSLIDYYANFDALFNLYSTDLFYVGLLSGVGIGGVNLHYRDAFLGNRISNGFQLNLKLGARLNMQDHGVELVLKLPFLGPSIEWNQQAQIKMQLKQHYNLSMAYVYNFATH